MLCATLLSAGCMPRSDRSAGATSDSGEGTTVILRNLSYHDGILEGELVNQSKKEARVVLIDVSFEDSSGKQLFTQDFKAVPGGDGRALLPGYVKHFNYRLTLAGSAKISVAGTIKSIDYK